MATKKKGLPRALTENAVDELVNHLVLSPVDDPCRKFLESRQLWDPEWISKLEIGSFGTSLVFVQRDEAGRLMPRYRLFDTQAPKEKRWSWSIGEGMTLSFWPWYPIPKDATLWVFEGEWDTQTALIRLNVTDAGMHAITFTCGAGVPIPAGAIPTWARGKPVNICYDNDVYQGPDWATHKAPSDKALAGMRQRRNALLKTAKSFERWGCEVILRAIPVDPLESWGGDFRDWVNKGGRDLESIPHSLLGEALLGETEVIERHGVDEVVHDVGLTTRFRCSVQTVEEELVVVPFASELDCDLGNKRYCADCRAPLICPEKVIDYSDQQDLLAKGLTHHNFEKYILKHYLGQPGRCSFATVRPITYRVMCRWTATTTDDGMREITVLSEQVPNMSGETEVEGSVHHGDNGVIVVMARKTSHVGQEKPNIELFKDRLKSISPPPLPSVDQIADHIEKRADQMSLVTEIHGRRRLHEAFLLLYHSALWITLEGNKQRGWLDIAVIGDTGSGKSSVAKRWVDWIGKGSMHLCMENVSRAGLTMGGIKGFDGNFHSKPGLFPRSNGKLLILDEFHVMVEDTWQRGEKSPLTHLQSARDMGHVEGVKVYGTRRLSSAVRLATIANWCGGRASSRKFACEHFGVLYGRPEILRRLDFGVVVQDEPDLTPVEVEPLEQPLARILVQRAWSMGPAEVLIQEPALRRAKEIAEMWRERYSEDLCLFTYADKPNSLLRLATAAANVCFSHPADQPSICLVTENFVEWARVWLEQLWLETGYEEFSAAAKMKEDLGKPFHVEHNLTVDSGLYDATDALQALDRLFAPFMKSELQSVLGKSLQDVETWCAKMVRLGALESIPSTNFYHREWRLTKGAFKLLRNLVAMATDAPEQYSIRAAKLGEWMTRSGGRKDSEPMMPNLAIDEEAAKRLWEEGSAV